MKALRLAAALVLSVGSTSASAQEAPRGDLFAGYSMLASDGETMHGWHAALGWGLTKRVGLLFDASGHEGGDGEGTDVSLLSLMAGPRATFGGGRVRPFVHLIAGIVRTRASIGIFEVQISESSSDFGAAAGGGFDLGFGERWALRLAGDYRIVKLDEGDARDPRFSAGVTYRFGAP